MTILITDNFSLRQGTVVPAINLPPPSPANNRTRAKSYYDIFSKGWDYVEIIIGIAGNIMSIVAETSRKLSCKTRHIINKTIERIDLLSIVNIPLNITSISAKVKKIWKSKQWGDREGTVLTTISLTLLLGGMFSTITSAINMVLKSLTQKQVKWISAASLPLAIALSAIDLAMEARHFYRFFKFKREFDRELMRKSQSCPSQDLPRILRSFLEKHLNMDNDDKASRVKIRVLKRATTGKVVLQFKKLCEIMKENNHLTETHHEEIFNHLKTITHLLNTEKVKQTVSMVATTVSTIAVGLFLHPPAALVSSCMLIVSSAIGLGIMIHKDLSN